jgi:hypothetical protein
MIVLGRQLTARGIGVLNLFFHSSEAIVGASPYNTTESDLAAFFERLGRFFRVAADELGAVPMTFREYHDRFVTAPFDRQGQGPGA